MNKLFKNLQQNVFPKTTPKETKTAEKGKGEAKIGSTTFNTVTEVKNKPTDPVTTNTTVQDIKQTPEQKQENVKNYVFQVIDDFQSSSIYKEIELRKPLDSYKEQLENYEQKVSDLESRLSNSFDMEAYREISTLKSSISILYSSTKVDDSLSDELLSVNVKVFIPLTNKLDNLRTKATQKYASEIKQHSFDTETVKLLKGRVEKHTETVNQYKTDLASKNPFSKLDPDHLITTNEQTKILHGIISEHLTEITDKGLKNELETLLKEVNTLQEETSIQAQLANSNIKSQQHNQEVKDHKMLEEYDVIEIPSSQSNSPKTESPSMLQNIYNLFGFKGSTDEDL
ncbi:MAG: hypothetical protein COZ46_06655 [Verrucomicrobia bacterium CG_4_10_14_3_um_filter_43_23]|nr:MAG: hypothetical protein AUJ82_05245 [Verrucomicrobia bacterium CG1_02_43_26]PIP58734.1 MAG: hypothetical protein COX01_06890 [Verrucomicrobia bacterium CG22_combo_CG10-13_8_21_14_all_43_17]PIX57915.1 MAG: hypothetical protein COZ46_06655 [Verrucomicrobia bacterium CG_4_10_14_3_um_filter_43_23]PIY61138.1 MAG: hypothetical protein COY94_06980 [Verrucomicrobia bacterium CG_4_10_14_0_8_um_filter_43_34]PJA43475.1 MAG: hypothetical protein CO175_07825 [Verrucomicrobia bacterium CG_4_9_14_3_um_fi